MRISAAFLQSFLQATLQPALQAILQACASLQARSLLLIFAIALGPLATWARAAPAPAAATGWWLDQSGRAGILVAPCGSRLCGHIAWLQQPLDAKNGAKTDLHNPDQTLRRRPLCGLPILGGFVPDDSSGWTDGWIYDPQLGKTYKSVMHIRPDGTLSLRGYIGIPLFGRSTIWTRPAAPLTQCTVAR
jgi:uncharacterized protein (DUF2147 family)